MTDIPQQHYPQRDGSYGSGERETLLMLVPKIAVSWWSLENCLSREVLFLFQNYWIMESYNCLSWKRLLRSESLIVNPVLPGSSLTFVPECYLLTFLCSSVANNTIISLGILFQCLTGLWAKKFFIIPNLNLPCCFLLSWCMSLRRRDQSPSGYKLLPR